MMYRIVKQLIDIHANQLNPINTRTRGHTIRFIIPKARTTLLKETVFPDTIRIWNSLPQHVVESPSVDAFEARVRDANIS